MGRSADVDDGAVADVGRLIGHRVYLPGAEARPVEYGERFEDALVYAARLHRGQHRKGDPVPYVTHLLAVAALTGQAGGDEDEVIAALLHDAVEDQGGHPTLREIRSRFGERVAEIVNGCTDAWEKPKPPWRERKESFLARLQEASASVVLVTCADKVHNAQCTVGELRRLGGRVWERFSAGPDEQLWLYRSLAGVLRARQAPEMLLEELERLVDELEAFAGDGGLTPRS